MTLRYWVTAVVLFRHKSLYFIQESLILKSYISFIRNVRASMKHFALLFTLMYEEEDLSQACDPAGKLTTADSAYSLFEWQDVSGNAEVLWGVIWIISLFLSLPPLINRFSSSTLTVSYPAVSLHSQWWKWLMKPSAAQQILSCLISLLLFINATRGATLIPLSTHSISFLAYPSLLLHLSSCYQVFFSLSPPWLISSHKVLLPFISADIIFSSTSFFSS